MADDDLSGPEGKAYLIQLSGELDVSNASAVRERLIEAASHHDHLIVSLRDVTFMDSVALGVIVSTHRRLLRRGGNLQLADPQAAVWRLLHITGVTNSLTIRKLP